MSVKPAHGLLARYLEPILTGELRHERVLCDRDARRARVRVSQDKRPAQALFDDLMDIGDHLVHGVVQEQRRLDTADDAEIGADQSARVGDRDVAGGRRRDRLDGKGAVLFHAEHQVTDVTAGVLDVPLVDGS